VPAKAFSPGNMEGSGWEAPDITELRTKIKQMYPAVKWSYAETRGPAAGGSVVPGTTTWQAQ
jgi:hypothetical protein